MTKFETLLRLSEIKGAILACGNEAALDLTIELIDDLESSLSDEDLAPAGCTGCGCPSHDRCHDCGSFHD